ncbi:MAG: heavy-metal-associated domain-containing protein [Deltaproteobacteria bacterium]|nr:heavy-metal-associated domain-containing protein [Deltaproteobacteria bacterium]MBW2253324.1 heavy-metal-associated domain-containing protein [Deltaproteobacteria bacterium]
MKTFNVDGMSCMHCVMSVTKALEAVPGVDQVVEVDLERGVAVVDGEPDDAAVIEAIAEEGYEARVV